MEKVRMLAELVQKRERKKLRLAEVLAEVLEPVLFPHDAALRGALKTISALASLSTCSSDLSRTSD